MTKSVLFIPLFAIFTIACNDDEQQNTEVTRLDYYIEYIKNSDAGFTPQAKVQFVYNEENRLEKYSTYTYNSQSAQMDEQESFVFSYDNSLVKTIEGFAADEENPIIRYEYEYEENRVKKITQTHINANLISHASFSYNSTKDSISITYTSSVGSPFLYTFAYRNSNLVADETKKGSQHCNDGTYTYDQHHNPFNSLGYTDFYVRNISANNRLTEEVNYVGCSFPEYVPDHYTYEYNAQHYPVVSIMTYKTSGVVPPQVKREFFYQTISN